MEYTALAGERHIGLDQRGRTDLGAARSGGRCEDMNESTRPSRPAGVNVGVNGGVDGGVSCGLRVERSELVTVGRATSVWISDADPTCERTWMDL